MSLFSDLRHRISALFNRSRLEADRNEEFRFHLEQETLKYRRRGMPQAEAERQAAIAFGNRGATLEAVRDQRGTRWLEDAAHDLRYATRQLARSPGFTLVAVITLALGIGANTAIFSVVDGVLLRPVTLADAGRLIVIWETDRASSTTREPGSWPDFVDYRREARTLAGAAAVSGTDVSLLPERGEPVRISGAAITANYFELVGLAPIVGRQISEAEDAPNGPLVTLLGERIWRDRFNADPAVLGSTVRLNDRPYTIIGVMPSGTDFALDQINARADYHPPYSGEGEVDVWVPLQASEQNYPRATHPIFLLGRLAPGATLESATAELTGISARLEQGFPENANRGVNPEPIREVAFGTVKPVLILLLAAVVLVLLVACVNVANLLLARGTRRAREVAMRSALGAGMGRLSRQFMAETVLLTIMGAVAGVGVALVGLKALLALVPAEVPRVADVGIDLRVLLATLAVSIGVGLVFGLVPTLQSLRLDVISHVKGEGLSGTGGPKRHRIRNALVVTELSLSVVLVLLAGLLIRSFGSVMQVDPGFNPAGILKAEYQLPGTRYPRDYSKFPNWTEISGFTRSVLEQAAAIPGVTAAAIASDHPLDRGFTNSWGITGRDNAGERLPEISVRQVSTGYFATMGSKLLQGRLFDERDGAGQQPVAVLNQTTVKRYFQDQDPIGREIRFWGINRQIIGVVSDEKIHGLTEETPPAAYISLVQAPSPSGVLLIRTEGDPASLASQARQAIWSADPQLAVFGIEPLDLTLLSSVGQRRFAMLVLIVFAGLTLALALVGIYGVLSYATEQRTREIGIRAALGAQRGRVAALVVREGTLLASLGIGIGLAGAFAGSRLLGSLLFGISRLDFLTHLIVPVVVLGAALVAMWVPAWRASRVSPVEALRME